MVSTPTIIRKSPVFFTVKVLLMVTVLSTLYAIVIYFTDIDTNLNASVAFFHTIEVGFFAFILIILIEIGYALVLVLHWTHETYEVHFDEIIHRFGLFTVRERRYALKNIEHILCKYSLWGRLLRYGSIELQGRFLKVPVILKGISDASYHADLIKQTTILSNPQH